MAHDPFLAPSSGACDMRGVLKFCGVAVGLSDLLVVSCRGLLLLLLLLGLVLDLDFDGRYFPIHRFGLVPKPSDRSLTLGQYFPSLKKKWDQ